MAAERQRVLTVTMPSPLSREQLPGLSARTCALLAGGGCELLLCEVSGVATDAVAVDALARLALAARRSGCEVRLRGASPELIGLVELIGLGGVLRPEDARSVRPLGFAMPVAAAARRTAEIASRSPGRT